MTNEDATATAAAGAKGKRGAKGEGGRKAARAAAGEGRAGGRKTDPVLVRMVARALWRATVNLPEDATPEARTAAWEAAKEASVESARAMVRSLQAKGVTMTAPAGGKAGEDDA